MLMILYRSPALSFIPETMEDHGFRKVHRALAHWKDIKIVWRELQRSKAIFARLGLKVDEVLP
jgi:hypothetical protein